MTVNKRNRVLKMHFHRQPATVAQRLPSTSSKWRQRPAPSMAWHALGAFGAWLQEKKCQNYPPRWSPDCRRTRIVLNSRCEFGKVGAWFSFWAKSRSDFGKVGVWFWWVQGWIWAKSRCGFGKFKAEFEKFKAEFGLLSNSRLNLGRLILVPVKFKAEFGKAGVGLTKVCRLVHTLWWLSPHTLWWLSHHTLWWLNPHTLWWLSPHTLSPLCLLVIRNHQNAIYIDPLEMVLSFDEKSSYTPMTYEQLYIDIAP